MDSRSPDHGNFGDRLDNGSREALERALADERLSAYLDGESTAAEQAELEARMAASAEFRQIVDELRGVRSGLELLPRHRLDDRFAERVLRRAERKVLLDDAADANPIQPGVVPPAAATGEAGGWAGRHERIWSARPFLWSVAALAAAILILVTQRDPEVRRDPIARGPAAPKAPVEDNRVAPKHERAQTVRQDRKASVGETELETTGEGQAQSGPANRSDLSPVEPKLADSADESKVLRERMMLPSTGAPEKRGAALADPNGRADKLEGALENTVRMRSATDRDFRDVAADQPPAPPALNETPPPAPSGLGQTESDNTQVVQEDAAGKVASALSKDSADSPANLALVRVVQVDMTRDAWERGAMENVLARNGITVYDADVAAGVNSLSGPNQSAQHAARPLSANSGNSEREFSYGQAATDDAKREPGADSKRSEASQAQTANRPQEEGLKTKAGESFEELNATEFSTDAVDLLIVNATKAQIDGALGELQAGREFHVLQVTAPRAGAAPSTEASLGTTARRGSTVELPLQPAPAGIPYTAADEPAAAAPATAAGRQPLEDSIGKKIDGLRDLEAGGDVKRAPAESKAEDARSASATTSPAEPATRGRDVTTNPSAARRSINSRSALPKATAADDAAKQERPLNATEKPQPSDAGAQAPGEAFGRGADKSGKLNRAPPVQAGEADREPAVSQEGVESQRKAPQAAEPEDLAAGVAGGAGNRGGYGGRATPESEAATEKQRAQSDKAGYGAMGGAGGFGGGRSDGASFRGGIGGVARGDGAGGPDSADRLLGRAARVRLLARSSGGSAATEDKALYFLRQHGDLVRALDAHAPNNAPRTTEVLKSQTRTFGSDANKELEAQRQLAMQREKDTAEANTAALGARVTAADQSLPEQVLFVVRVVDMPAGTVRESAASKADLTEQDKRATRRDSADLKSGSAETPPVPAPTPAGSGK